MFYVLLWPSQLLKKIITSNFQNTYLNHKGVLSFHLQLFFRKPSKFSEKNKNIVACGTDAKRLIDVLLGR